MSGTTFWSVNFTRTDDMTMMRHGILRLKAFKERNRKTIIELESTEGVSQSIHN